MKNLKGTRENRWGKYFNENPNQFKIFQGFWGSKTDEKYLANEMWQFYQHLSRRIHKFEEWEDIEWIKQDIGGNMSRIIGHMCDSLNIRHKIHELDTNDDGKMRKAL